MGGADGEEGMGGATAHHQATEMTYCNHSPVPGVRLSLGLGRLRWGPSGLSEEMGGSWVSSPDPLLGGRPGGASCVKWVVLE